MDPRVAVSGLLRLGADRIERDARLASGDVAGGVVGRGELEQRWVDGEADLLGERAAWVVGAAGLGLGQDGRRAVRAQRRGAPPRVSGSGTGTAAASARVYGWRGLSSTRSYGPASTTRPRYMTWISSLMCRTMPRSWLMKTKVSSQLVLQADQQVHHLGAHRDVERRGRLVEHEDPRLDGERAGDGDALGLAARELVRVAAGEARRERDHLQQPG